MRSNRDEKTSEATRQRAQSTVIGVVLLIGIVAIGSVSIFVVASGSAEQAQRAAEQERVEQSFVELSQSVTTSSVDDLSGQSMAFEQRQYGTMAKTDEGQITITYGDESEENTTEIPLGAIEYEGTDGSVVAYQAGGVWRGQGTETQMVSAPPIHYRDGTLTLPVTNVTGQQNLGAGELTASHGNTTSHGTQVVENETVEMTIQSEYYRGWASYFEAQAGETVVREVYDNNQTVVVKLGFMEISESFEDGIATSDFDPGAPGQNHDENVTQGGPYRALDESILQVVDEAKTGERNINYEFTDTIDSNENFEDETVFARDGIGKNADLEFDLSDGNATLIVDGDIIADGDTITVSDRGEGNTLQVFVTSHYDASQGGDVCVDPCDEDISGDTIQIFGMSDMAVQFGPGGNSRLEGTLYAAGGDPNWETLHNSADSSYQMNVQATPDLYGSIVVESARAQGDATIKYDENMDDIDTEIVESYFPPQIHYLNVAEHEIEIDDE